MKIQIVFKHNLVAVTILLLFLFVFKVSFALESPGLSLIGKEDRILIFAPHPDDEAIGTAGVIQKALKAGAKVKIVCYTNGDNNEIAFIVYEKRLTFKKREFLHMGEVRRKETLMAMDSLGLSQNNIISLGYPDFGTMEILTKYWGDTKPFRSMFARTNQVSYPEAMSPNAPYVGESILKDLKKIIFDFKPTHIFVSHPADKNRDHRSLYLFLQVALWDLEKQIKQPEIFPYIIHIIGWPMPRGYHPELELDPPEKLNNNAILWQKLELTQEEIEAKRKATSFYKSQIECDPPYLFTFARKNELFGNFPVIKLKKEKPGEIYWQYLKIGKDNEEVKKDDTKDQADRITTLAYAINNNSLLIKLTSNRKRLRLAVYLLGYNKKIDFAKMPKINLAVDRGGLHIKDKKQTLFIKDAQLHYNGKNEAVIKVSLATLGNPDYILSCTMQPVDLSLDEMSWRILQLE